MLFFQHPRSQPSIIYWLFGQVGRFVRLVSFFSARFRHYLFVLQVSQFGKEEEKFIFLKCLDLAKGVIKGNSHKQKYIKKQGDGLFKILV